MNENLDETITVTVSPAETVVEAFRMVARANAKEKMILLQASAFLGVLPIATTVAHQILSGKAGLNVAVRKLEELSEMTSTEEIKG